MPKTLQMVIKRLQSMAGGADGGAVFHLTVTRGELTSWFGQLGTFLLLVSFWLPHRERAQMVVLLP